MSVSKIDFEYIKDIVKKFTDEKLNKFINYVNSFLEKTKEVYYRIGKTQVTKDSVEPFETLKVCNYVSDEFLMKALAYCVTGFKLGKEKFDDVISMSFYFLVQLSYMIMENIVNECRRYYEEDKFEEFVDCVILNINIIFSNPNLLRTYIRILSDSWRKAIEE